MYFHRYLSIYLPTYHLSIYLSLERGDYFEELAHEIVEAGKSKSYRVGRQARDAEIIDVAAQVQKPFAGRSLSSSRKIRLFLSRPSTDWMRPTLITEGLLSSNSADLNINLI